MSRNSHEIEHIVSLFYLMPPSNAIRNHDIGVVSIKTIQSPIHKVSLIVICILYSVSVLYLSVLAGDEGYVKAYPQRLLA